ncbi:hypothetical protein GCM10010191_05820 [Actinomadura vinacea]|uniref:NB-ARC domain-containing protein n=1 Tax=Actinomadura vinacea TaxID=115336 RepID=A0ABN3IEX4_9ACTN
MRVEECAAPSVPGPGPIVDIAGLPESAACAALVRGLVARGALAEADLPAGAEPPSGDGVPYPQDGPAITNLGPPEPGFLGREDLLRRLRAALVRGDAHDDVRVAVVWGLGGVGKTSVAVNFAHRFRRHYEIVWWLTAERSADLRTGLLRLAAELGVPEQADADRMINELWRALCGRGRWLLIYDNAGAEPVRHWPAGGGGHVLVTSRRSDWAGPADPERRFEVRPMAAGAAVRLLCERTGDDDVRSAQAIADALGRLPLALAHAAAYSRQAALPLREYLRLLDGSLEQVLSRFRPDDHVQPVAMTWNLSLARAGEDVPETLDLMRLWSMLAPVRIPRGLLRGPADGARGRLAAITGDPLSYDLAVQRLARYSLIGVDAEHVQVHRLVQTVVRLDMEPADAAEWLEAAAILLERRFPQAADDSARWTTARGGRTARGCWRTSWPSRATTAG